MSSISAKIQLVEENDMVGFQRKEKEHEAAIRGGKGKDCFVGD